MKDQSQQSVPDSIRFKDVELFLLVGALCLQGVLQQPGDDVVGWTLLWRRAHWSFHFLKEHQILALHLAQFGLQSRVLQVTTGTHEYDLWRNHCNIIKVIYSLFSLGLRGNTGLPQKPLELPVSVNRANTDRQTAGNTFASKAFSLLSAFLRNTVSSRISLFRNLFWDL